ncbi:tetratricopeptide repeat-containing sensor histidine kinase [Polaribacter sargassicola]|uniref:tetratricopeptide repeat-containing sensor histidine kinase n=1 Tax=Polaribacter sargassicola TaxID=2836891 RepID=UPI001F304150
MNNRTFDAYENYITSRNLYLSLNNKDSLAKCNINLFYLIQSQNNLNENPILFLDNYTEYAKEKRDSLMLLISNNAYAAYFWDSKHPYKSRKFYDKSILITQKKELQKYRSTIYSNLAHLYSLNQKDSAKYYFDKTLKSIDKLDKKQLLDTYINYCNFFQSQKKFKQAILLLEKAEKIKIADYQQKYNKILYKKFADCYKETGNYKKAYEYYEKYDIIKDSLNITAQNIAISDLNIKYETEKKDKLNLQLEIDKKKSQNFLIATLLSLILISVIGTLLIKNSNKKRKVAEQQKELEKQKNLTLLKEQELTTINAIINGQEKERKQIAEDLHDNLGSILATLKLHFDNLKINHTKKKIDQETLFNKTEGLIDEAYLKVRSIAHAKNAGVIANQGLLVAIKMMAEKISSADKIKIDVVDFGLNKRLENSLEIGIFRIVQELTTNIIKHADAKNATINLSFYDQNLNIIIEDNGKGFDINNVNLKNGMGISSIKTRIKHLNGTFEIDSTIGKGSSVIIDIPVD